MVALIMAKGPANMARKQECLVGMRLARPKYQACHLRGDHICRQTDRLERDFVQ